MLHDENAFPDHISFKPERWLDTHITKEIDPLLIGFGFGRRWINLIHILQDMFILTASYRECPGRNLAHELLFTIISNVLAVFDIVKACDEHGNEITPSGEYTDTSIRYVSRLHRGYRSEGLTHEV